MEEIKDVIWWNDKIKEFKLLDFTQRLEFMNNYSTYYIVCQEFLYKHEDPYHMTYRTLQEFLFYNYIVNDIEIAKIVYDHYNVKLQYNHLQVCLWTICKNNYLPAILWLHSNNLLHAHINSCFISACSNGSIDMVEYLYDHTYDLYTLNKAYNLSITNNKDNIIKVFQEKGFIPPSPSPPPS
jgi:hypothetical protein